jgi:hypothetical protein
VESALRLFMEQPFHSRLKNHALSGHLQGLCAISAGYDLRIVYGSEGGGHARVLLLNTGLMMRCVNLGRRVKIMPASILGMISGFSWF